MSSDSWQCSYCGAILREHFPEEHIQPRCDDMKKRLDQLIPVQPLPDVMSWWRETLEKRR